MRKAHYSFTTRFSLSAPRETVWKTLLDVSGWKRWWKGVRSVHTTGAGATEKVTMTIGFIYTLTFTMTKGKIVEGELIALSVTGDLEGEGNFVFSRKDGATHVDFLWDISTTKPWMNFIAPVARPFFVAAHNGVMHFFVRGLARELHATIKTAEYLTNPVN